MFVYVYYTYQPRGIRQRVAPYVHVINTVIHRVLIFKALCFKLNQTQFGVSLSSLKYSSQLFQIPLCKEFIAAVGIKYFIVH